MNKVRNHSAAPWAALGIWGCFVAFRVQRYISSHVNLPGSRGYENVPSVQAVFFLLEEFPLLVLLLGGILLPWVVKPRSSRRRQALLAILLPLAWIAACANSVTAFSHSFQDPRLYSHSGGLPRSFFAPYAWLAACGICIVGMVGGLVLLMMRRRRHACSTKT